MYYVLLIVIIFPIPVTLLPYVYLKHETKIVFTQKVDSPFHCIKILHVTQKCCRMKSRRICTLLFCQSHWRFCFPCEPGAVPSILSAPVPDICAKQGNTLIYMQTWRKCPVETEYCTRMRLSLIGRVFVRAQSKSR